MKKTRRLLCMLLTVMMLLNTAMPLYAAAGENPQADMDLVQEAVTPPVGDAPSDTLAAEPIKIDDRDPSITYTPAWSQWNEGVHHLTTLTYTTTADLVLEYTFVGTKIEIYGQKSTTSGTMKVTIDGVDAGTANFYVTGATVNQALAYTSETLENKKHTLKAVVASGGGQVAVDFLAVADYSALPPDPGPEVKPGEKLLYQSNYENGEMGTWTKQAATTMELVQDETLHKKVLKITPSENNEYLELTDGGKVKDGRITVKIKSAQPLGVGPIIRSQGGQSATFLSHHAAWYLGDDSKGNWNNFSQASAPTANVWREAEIIFAGNTYTVKYGDVTWTGEQPGLNTGKGYCGLNIKNGTGKVPVYIADVLVVTTEDLVILPDEKDHENAMKLWYKEPAYHWETEALPLGNGAMGAMVYGQVKDEKVQINDKTLWMGGPGGVEDYTGGIKEGAYNNLDPMRQALKAGNTNEVNRLAGELAGKDLTTNGWGSYQNVGDILFHFDGFTQGDTVSNYRRELNLANGVAATGYTHKGVDYTREYLVSYPDNVMAFHFAANQKGKVSFTLDPQIDTVYPAGMPDTPPNVDPSQPTKQFTRTAAGDTITAKGTVTENGMKFEVQYKVVTENGTVTANADGTIAVSGADNATVYVVTGTDYANESSQWTQLHTPPDYRGADPHEKVTATMALAATKGYAAIRSAHVADVSAMMGRVTLDIGQGTNDVPTNELVAAYKKTPNQDAEHLFFQFGRYLLLSSSRGDTLPANLQGIWNHQNKPAWSSDYHFNVNLQMNYWPAYTTNLAEMGKPLVDYVESLVAPGRLTAAEHHGIKDGGWTVHTINNPFGMTAPGWAFTWGWSPASNAWICQNLWDYYEFTQDKTVLENQIYPIMREAALFWTKNLVDDGSGGLMSSPTYSSEHGPITAGNTYDQALTYQLMQDTVKAAQALGIAEGADKEFCDQLTAMMAKLNPYAVGSWGQIKEWREEDTWTDRGASLGVEKGHRHMSHLLGLYPGNQITPETPALYEAAKVSLKDRGPGGAEWADAQKMLSWARVRDGENAYKMYENLLKKSTYGNLFSAYGSFLLIDGNCGGTAGVAEMLLQSHGGYIDFLPALPAAWETGSVTGLVARGNYEVSMDWTKGNLKKWEITAKENGTCQIYLPGYEVSQLVKEGNNVVPVTYADGVLSFTAEQGKTYTQTISSVAVAVTAPLERGIYQRDEADAAEIPVALHTETGKTVKAQLVKGETVVANWAELAEAAETGEYSGTFAAVPAGGWYQLNVQVFEKGTENCVGKAAVSRVGVGDLYITSGQSNSVYGTELTAATQDTVSVYNTNNDTWVECIDPLPMLMPAPNSEGGGAPWSFTGDSLSKALGVPVGFVLTGMGGATVGDMNTTHYPRIKDAIDSLAPYHGCKAILWHQGEADAAAGTTLENYQKTLEELIAKTRTDAGVADLPWVIANAAYLPTNTRVNQQIILQAQRAVCNAAADDKIYLGPITDDIGPAYRGDGIHFNAAGLKIHGTRWAESLLQTFFGTPAPEAPRGKMLDDRHPDLIFSENWISYAESGHYDGSIMYLTGGKSGTVDLTFTGTGVRVYVDSRAFRGGSFTVSVDGSPKDLDPALNHNTCQDVIYEITDLTLGTHTIQVTGNADTGTAVFDAFEVLNSESSLMEVRYPTDRAIYQRGEDNKADVLIQISYKPGMTLEARLGDSGTWTALTEDSSTGIYSGKLAKVPAGGWYQMNFRAKNGDAVMAEHTVAHVGVGDVFMTGGQSNSMSFGSVKTAAKSDAVSTYDPLSDQWVHCEDTQPALAGNNGTGGSPWPTMGDKLTAETGFPVGFILTGWGGASIAELGGGYYNRIEDAIASLAPYGFRAFLWHQGETDAIAGTTAETYQQSLLTLIAKTREDAGFPVPWIVANAAFHPGATEANTQQILQGQRDACNETDIFLGPNTDQWGAQYRAEIDGVHFNAEGLVLHGSAWAEVISKKLLDTVPDEVLPGMEKLKELVLSGKKLEENPLYASVAEDAKAAFRAALNQAVALLKNAGATAEELAAGEQALDTAIGAMSEAIAAVRLNGKITQAAGYLEKSADYGTLGYQQYQDALAAARAALESGKNTETAYDALRDAIFELRELPEKQ